MSKDIIYRQDAIDALNSLLKFILIDSNENLHGVGVRLKFAVQKLEQLPSAQSEPLTDKEQRIFLAAMDREMKVCEEVDRNYVREPYEDSLVSVCREIKRKVKGALWTI